MNEKIDIIYELVKDFRDELKEKDILIRRLQEKQSATDVEMAGKASQPEFHDLCIKVNTISVRSTYISLAVGFIISVSVTFLLNYLLK